MARCNHGCVIPPPDHAVSKFMNKLFDGALLSDSGEDLFVGIWCGLAESFEEHPDVWKDVENRQVAVGVLISIATNMILDRGTLGNIGHVNERLQLMIIVFLDSYDGKGDYVHAIHGAMVRSPALCTSCGERDMLKFFTKKLPCSCLEERYKQARKNLPKMAECVNCGQEKERSSLRMTCGRCKVPGNASCSRAKTQRVVQYLC